MALAVTQFVPIFISVIRTANRQERQQQLGEAAALLVSIGLIAVNGVVIIAYVVCAWKERGTAVAKARVKAGRVCVALRRCCSCCGGTGRRGGGGEQWGSLGGEPSRRGGELVESRIAARGEDALNRWRTVESRLWNSERVVCRVWHWVWCARGATAWGLSMRCNTRQHSLNRRTNSLLQESPTV